MGEKEDKWEGLMHLMWLALKLIPSHLPPPFPVVVNCPEGMFLCAENMCIAGSLQCDGIPDCANGLDEQSCESKCNTLHSTIVVLLDCHCSQEVMDY